MSKSSKSKGKTIKVPKRVAGVKIPKAVRKGPVLQFVNSSAGKLLMAEAITAALGAIAYKGSASSENIKASAMDAEDALRQGASRLTHAFAEGVRAFRRALAEDAPPGADDQDLSTLDAEEMPAASKKGYRRSSPAATNAA